MAVTIVECQQRANEIYRGWHADGYDVAEMLARIPLVRVAEGASPVVSRTATTDTRVLLARLILEADHGPGEEFEREFQRARRLLLDPKEVPY